MLFILTLKKQKRKELLPSQRAAEPKNSLAFLDCTEGKDLPVWRPVHWILSFASCIMNCMQFCFFFFPDKRENCLLIDIDISWTSNTFILKGSDLCRLPREVIDYLVGAYSRSTPKIFEGQMPVFDGRKNMYTKKQLPIGQEKVRSDRRFLPLFASKRGYQCHQTWLWFSSTMNLWYL